VALKAFTPLTYLAAASGYPLVDSALTRLDAILFGFEWNVEANGSPITRRSIGSFSGRTLAYIVKALWYF
jgi:hypothetical protein